MEYQPGETHEEGLVEKQLEEGALEYLVVLEEGVVDQGIGHHGAHTIREGDQEFQGVQCHSPTFCLIPPEDRDILKRNMLVLIRKLYFAGVGASN